MTTAVKRHGQAGFATWVPTVAVPNAPTKQIFARRSSTLREVSPQSLRNLRLEPLRERAQRPIAVRRVGAARLCGRQRQRGGKRYLSSTPSLPPSRKTFGLRKIDRMRAPSGAQAS